MLSKGLYFVSHYILSSGAFLIFDLWLQPAQRFGGELSNSYYVVSELGGLEISVSGCGHVLATDGGMQKSCGVGLTHVARVCCSE